MTNETLSTSIAASERRRLKRRLKRRRKQTIAKCRIGKVHVGEYFDRSMRDELHRIAEAEQTTIGMLLAEGIGAVLYARWIDRQTPAQETRP